VNIISEISKKLKKLLRRKVEEKKKKQGKIEGNKTAACRVIECSGYLHSEGITKLFHHINVSLNLSIYHFNLVS
jgi:hypothetical protein